MAWSEKKFQGFLVKLGVHFEHHGAQIVDQDPVIVDVLLGRPRRVVGNLHTKVLIEPFYDKNLNLLHWGNTF